MKVVLAIGGSNSSGATGIQADVKTIQAQRHYAETVLTGIGAENTERVISFAMLESQILKDQLQAVFEDIVPDAVKIGYLGSAENISCVAAALKEYGAQNIVLDPVMLAGGIELMDAQGIEALLNELAPLVSIMTPNIPAATRLCGFEINGREDMHAAALKLREYCLGAILIKGGHGVENGTDLLITEHGREVWLQHKRFDCQNVKGAGCTLASAIACGLASGFDMQAAVQKAKNYVTGALKHDPLLGKGTGPLDHMWDY